MEELDPLCDQFHEIHLKDTFYDNLFLLCKYVDDETIGDENATTAALEKMHTDPDYNENMYKIWLYSTISKWHKAIQESGKFAITEEATAIYLMRAITEISRTAICYDGSNILSELIKIITNSFSEYSVTGWKFLCSEHTFETLMRSRNSYSVTSSQYISEFEGEDVEAFDEENMENAEEIREYEEKCKVLTDIATKFLSCKFALTITKLAAQKFVDRTISLQSDLVFNVPKTYHKWVEPKHMKIHKKKSKDKKMIMEEEAEPEPEINYRDMYEIFPTRMSLQADSQEFWEGLVKKYSEQNETKIEQAAADDPDDTKKPKKTKKGKKVETM